MFLVVGLGNPGREYESHRHNVGCQVVDRLAASADMPVFAEKKGCVVTQGILSDQKVMCAKPCAYMNVSGPPVAHLARFYKVPVQKVLVVHDELALPLGKIRVKWGGSAAGHNGLKSLDAHLGAEYGRVRFGIDHPGDRDAVKHFVLSDFTPAEQQRVNQVVDNIVRYFDLLFSEPNLFVTRLAAA